MKINMANNTAFKISSSCTKSEHGGAGKHETLPLAEVLLAFDSYWDSFLFAVGGRFSRQGFPM